MYGIRNDRTFSNNLFDKNMNLMAVFSAEGKTRICNICYCTFNQNSRFDRFCEICRSNDELYKFADWAN